MTLLGFRPCVIGQSSRRPKAHGRKLTAGVMVVRAVVVAMIAMAAMIAVGQVEEAPMAGALGLAMVARTVVEPTAVVALMIAVMAVGLAAEQTVTTAVGPAEPATGGGFVGR